MKLLVATRHSPLPENDGSGAYLFDLLSYLRSQGVDIEIAWLQSDDALARQNWWRVPDRINRVAHLSIIGCLAIGPWRYFHWGHLKARLGSAFARQTRPASDSPLPAAAPAANFAPLLPLPTQLERPPHAPRTPLLPKTPRPLQTRRRPRQLLLARPAAPRRARHGPHRRPHLRCDLAAHPAQPRARSRPRHARRRSRPPQNRPPRHRHQRRRRRRFPLPPSRPLHRPGTQGRRPAA